MAATYTFDVFASVDGFGGHRGGWGGYWGKEGPEFLQRRAEQFSGEQRVVMGAGTMRMFAHFAGLGVLDPDPASWMGRMRSHPTYVMSTSIAEPVDWPHVTVLREDAVAAVARLKESSDVPIVSHGSLSMNRALMAAGLVDEVRLTVFPVITGQTGDDPVFTGAADFDLELLASTTLDGRIQELVYRPHLHHG